MLRIETFAAVIGAGVLVAGGVVAAQTAALKTAAAQPAKHVAMSPADLKWGPAPPSLPPGAQAAVLDGDPSQAGLFVLRLKLPDGYSVAPHSHPTDEHVTVMSGTFMAALGDKMDVATMQTLAPGAYIKMPANANHYARAKGETVVQITGTGPFQVKYVNPNDDPRSKAGSRQ